MARASPVGSALQRAFTWPDGWHVTRSRRTRSRARALTAAMWLGGSLAFVGSPGVAAAAPVSARTSVASHPSRPDPPADIAVTLSGPLSEVPWGDVFAETVTVTNHGPSTRHRRRYQPLCLSQPSRDRRPRSQQQIRHPRLGLTPRCRRPPASSTSLR